MKRLCLIIHSLQVGGMERVMTELAGYLSKQNNVQVHLILYGRNPQIFYKLPDEIIIQKAPKFTNEIRLIQTFRRFVFLRRNVMKINPNSILSFGENWNSFVILALMGLKYPIFVSDRCSPRKSLGFFHEILRKILYPNAAGTIVQTNMAKEIYERKFSLTSNLKVIGNPIREISDNRIILKENIILTVGRLIPSKNHANLIDSFLKLGIPDWKLMIVGGNALKMNLMEELQSKIVTLKAEDKVILAGNRSDIDHLYLKSRIFVSASESEGFPNVIGEAMSAGLPVVAFDCVAGPSEMIEDEINGFLVPLHDYKKMESRLLMLMTNPELAERIGREARRSIKRFSLDVIGKEYLSYISSKN